MSSTTSTTTTSQKRLVGGFVIDLDAVASVQSRGRLYTLIYQDDVRNKVYTISFTASYNRETISYDAMQQTMEQKATEYVNNGQTVPDSGAFSSIIEQPLRLFSNEVDPLHSFVHMIVVYTPKDWETKLASMQNSNVTILRNTMNETSAWDTLGHAVKTLRNIRIHENAILQSTDPEVLTRYHSLLVNASPLV